MDKWNSGQPASNAENQIESGGCKSALEAADICLVSFFLDDACSILQATAPFYRRTGHSEEEFRAAFPSLQRLYIDYPADFASIKNTLNGAFVQGKPAAELTVRFPLRQGDCSWMQYSCTIAGAPSGGRPLCHAVLTDVTELVRQREEQKSLYEDKAHCFRWMMDEYVGNIYISDIETYELLYLNRPCCETLARPLDELIGQKCYEVIQGRTDPCPFCTNSCLTEEKFYEWEFDNPLLERTFMIKNRLINWNGHKARIELSHDMFSPEYKLAKKDREREAIVQTVPGGFARVTARDMRTILWYGADFLQLIGYTKEQFESELHSQCSYVHPEDMERAVVMMRDAKETGEKKIMETRILTRSGELRYLTLTLGYVSAKDSWDGIPSFYSVGIDVTPQRIERERQRQVLQDAMLSAQQASEAKTNFLSRMSHEIRTPLNAIIGMTTIAAASVDKPVKVEDCLQKINFSSKHLLMLINDVLDMSKIESNRMTIQSEAFDLLEVCNRFVSTVYAQAKAKNIEFKETIEHLSAQNLYVGDPLRLMQILLNLSSNAVKFTSPGGAIRFEVDLFASKGAVDTVRFTLSDTGIGMTQESIERIFQPFEQADASIAVRFGGTGLGMTITKNLVALMNGKIRVESEPEAGTTCIVDLPFQRMNGTREEPDFGEQGLRALVVDDEPSACTQAVSILERIRISAESTQSGEAALERIKETHRAGDDFNLCLVDWKMPDMDGVELTRRIRAYLGQDIPIVLISAYDYTEIEEEARAAGANGFVSKPLYPSSVYAAIKDAMERLPAQKPKTNAELPLAGKRLLLAEDNPINQEIAVELLRMHGAEVECAENGEEAVRLFTVSRPGYFDAVLMDVQMPVMDGHEAVRRIRASGHPAAAALPILALTANAFTDDILKAQSAGMNGHIAKPIDVSLLLDTLRKWMG
ncbi:PAS domain-containing hybrid sensor histidine kinase/response regulator [Extibacter muris]|uniref:PAS domain-containing hybrid sensor histidine kinase/response regulator n=1 Tax=Extibacter muris TaxID=1796622 RepID=UPI001D092DB0|nr:PAS domain-containing hybrid sensor histidine kinase/response regulator [Extibacter muris]MCB6200473.1 response regulator [Extibacter muris]MCQ4663416.1 response regulator [Extibacter muris]MCQ4692840.1 response regulator [Extibacter muris]